MRIKGGTRCSECGSKVSNAHILRNEKLCWFCYSQKMTIFPPHMHDLLEEGIVEEIPLPKILQNKK